MESVENGKDNNLMPQNINSLSDSFKAYLVAREELIKKYGAKLPEWKNVG